MYYYNIIGFVISSLNAQVAVYNSQGELEHIPKLKKKTVYVQMIDLDSDAAKEQMEVYNKYWTYSDIEFIEKKDYRKYKKEGNFFMGFFFKKAYRYVEERGVLDEVRDGSFEPRDSRGTPSTFAFFLWVIEKNENGKLEKNELTAISLTVNPNVYFKLEDPFTKDFGLEGPILNWSPGYLKNYLQLMITHMDLEKPIGSLEKRMNESKIRQLKNNVLYIPESLLWKRRRKSESTPIDMNQLFKDYPYQVEKISDEALSEKILNDDEPFYYFMFHRPRGNKLYTIVESTTGKIIFSKSTTSGHDFWNLNEKTMEKIFKKIKKIK